MSRIAFITRQAPHGNAIAREAQDAILATSALTEALSVFFIGDGVYQLLKNQTTEHILSRNFSSTFKLFDLYDIDNVYVCMDSLIERGIEVQRSDYAGETASTPLKFTVHPLVDTWYSLVIVDAKNRRTYTNPVWVDVID